MATSAPNVVGFEPPAYAKGAGIIALILVIIAFFIPVFGVLFILPLAIIAGCIALYGGYKSFGIAVLILSCIKLAISPTFWLNVAAGASMDGAGANRFLSWLILIGVVTMFVLAIRKRRV